MLIMTDYIAIGDIHGMYNLLLDLLAQLPGEGTLVFLGDFVDRGPDSKWVVTRLLALSQQRPCIFLRGNHEAMMLDTMDDKPEAGDMWFNNGGVATIESYAFHIPDEHMAFFRATQPFFMTDDYIFVHGGLVPGQQPEETAPEELWWMREPFLSSTYDWGKLVIHGHTPVMRGKPDVHANRINIDTGAVYGGPLTAVLLPERDFKYARRP